MEGSTMRRCFRYYSLGGKCSKRRLGSSTPTASVAIYIPRTGIGNQMWVWESLSMACGEVEAMEWSPDGEPSAIPGEGRVGGTDPPLLSCFYSLNVHYMNPFRLFQPSSIQKANEKLALMQLVINGSCQSKADRLYCKAALGQEAQRCENAVNSQKYIW